MTTITFDTLAYTKKMKLAGFTDQQAEGQAEALSEIIEERVATKKDIVDLRSELKNDMLLLKVDLIKWMIGLFTGWGAILISVMAALKFLH